MLDKEFLEKQDKVLKKRKEEYAEFFKNPEGHTPQFVEFKREILTPLLNRAIEKMEEGTYGICDDCDEEIPQERLEKIPAALRCIPCQDKFEEMLKKKGIKWQ